MKTQVSPWISVIVVSWNTAEDTLRCVRAVLANDAERRIEVLVVDNASSDDTVGRLQGIDTRVRVISNSENIGFARACNQGMAASVAPFLVLINSDCVVSDAVIVRSARWLVEHPDCGMVGCELRNESGRRIYTAMRRLTVRRSLFENLWLYRLLPASRRPRVLLGGYWDGQEDIQADWLVGAYACLRREVFVDSGGFDERFFMYGEDSEWGMRLTQSGVRVAYAPTLGVVEHRGAASSRDLWSERERLRRGHEGGLRAYAMLHGNSRMQLYRAAQLIGYAVRWSVYAGLATLSPSDYFDAQRQLYGWLVLFYVSSPERI